MAYLMLSVRRAPACCAEPHSLLTPDVNLLPAHLLLMRIHYSPLQQRSKMRHATSSGMSRTAFLPVLMLEILSDKGAANQKIT